MNQSSEEQQNSEEQRYGGTIDTRSGLSRIRWGRVLLAGIAPHILWNIVLPVFVVFEDDPTFAAWVPWGATEGLINWFSVWGVYVVMFGATAAGAAVIGRTVPSDTAVVHGVLIGVVAASIALTFHPLGFTAVALFVLTVTAGWIGQLLGR